MIAPALDSGSRNRVETGHFCFSQRPAAVTRVRQFGGQALQAGQALYYLLPIMGEVALRMRPAGAGNQVAGEGHSIFGHQAG